MLYHYTTKPQHKHSQAVKKATSWANRKREQLQGKGVRVLSTSHSVTKNDAVTSIDLRYECSIVLTTELVTPQ